MPGTPRVTSRLLIPVAIAVSLSCAPAPGPAPADLGAQFANWFVHPTEHRLASLSRLSLTPRAWDSVGTALRSSSPLGSIVDTLTDSFGGSYLLGYMTPTSVQRDSLYALIVYLHGGVGAQTSTKGERAYEMLRPVAESLAAFAASPSANRQNPWWSPSGLDRIRQTICYMTLHYPIDPARVFVTGVSDGAVGTYAAASSLGGVCAGFLAASGSGVVLPSLNSPFFPQNMVSRPVYQVYAGRDSTFPAANTNAFLDAMEKMGVGIERSFHPSDVHDFGSYRESEMRSFADRIRLWRRPHASRVVSWVFAPGYPQMPENILSWQFVKPVKAYPYLNTYWRVDTMIVSHGGLASVTLSLPSSSIPADPWVRTGNRRAVRMQEVAASSRVALESMMITGFPAYPHDRRFFRVQFTTDK